MKIRTRFAPSPTGFMHVGNLRTALYEHLNALLAYIFVAILLQDISCDIFVSDSAAGKAITASVTIQSVQTPAPFCQKLNLYINTKVIK